MRLSLTHDLSFVTNAFRPRSHATISLGDAVIILGGHSSGNRVSTIGKHKIFR